jgi:4-aminobutyrate aminotransferase/(S)-3-amino-2-methylpropionate transaminase
MSVPPPGPRSRAIAARLAAVESPAVDARRASREMDSGAEQGPIVYASGRGANVIDVDGNRYVDLAAGFGALLLGHGRAEVLSAVEDQQRRLGLALGDVCASEVKLALCARLAGLYPEPRARVLLGSSGADAVTAALKTAMLATGRPGVVAFEGAYHGLSYGPLAACGLKPAFREPFAAQLNAHVTFAPYPEAAMDASLSAMDTSLSAMDASVSAMDASLAAVKRALAGGEVGAVLVEPILGRGGCVVPPAGFLEALRAACDASGALLVCDEIWTGLGRSGAWLASVDEGVLPDVVCLGKGLGGGLPLSACVGSERAMAAWGRHGGTTIHTATHFGAPPACAAALATLDVLERERLPERARATGAAWMERLREKTRGLGVREVRGRGLMVGVALEGGGGRALAATRTLLARGWIVLTGGAAGDVLTLTPPLDVDGALLDAFAEALATSLSRPDETSAALAP